MCMCTTSSWREDRYNTCGTCEKGTHVGLLPLLTGSVVWRGSLAEVRSSILDGLASVLGQILGVLLQVDVCTDNMFVLSLLVYFTDTCSLATPCRGQCPKQGTAALSGQEKLYKHVQNVLSQHSCAAQLPHAEVTALSWQKQYCQVREAEDFCCSRAT